MKSLLLLFHRVYCEIWLYAFRRVNMRLPFSAILSNAWACIVSAFESDCKTQHWRGVRPCESPISGLAAKPRLFSPSRCCRVGRSARSAAICSGVVARPAFASTPRLVRAVTAEKFRDCTAHATRDWPIRSSQPLFTWTQFNAITMSTKVRKKGWQRQQMQINATPILPQVTTTERVNSFLFGRFKF